MAPTLELHEDGTYVFTDRWAEGTVTFEGTYKVTKNSMTLVTNGKCMMEKKSEDGKKTYTEEVQINLTQIIFTITDYNNLVLKTAITCENDAATKTAVSDKFVRKE